jgi:hypothetical protein
VVETALTRPHGRNRVRSLHVGYMVALDAYHAQGARVAEFCKNGAPQKMLKEEEDVLYCLATARRDLLDALNNRPMRCTVRRRAEFHSPFHFPSCHRPAADLGARAHSHEPYTPSVACAENTRDKWTRHRR